MVLFEFNEMDRKVSPVVPGEACRGFFYTEKDGKAIFRKALLGLLVKAMDWLRKEPGVRQALEATNPST